MRCLINSNVHQAFYFQADVPTFMGVIDDSSKTEIPMDTDQTACMSYSLIHVTLDHTSSDLL